MPVGLLGEMLVERGAISVEQLHAGLVASRRGGERLGTSLVDSGYIDENALLEALADQHGVPYISASALFEYLKTLKDGVLPGSMVRSLRVVPFRKVRDRIQVAMSNPADARIIDRIANYTQLNVEPFVASDRTIEEAIARTQEMTLPDSAEVDLLTEVVASPGSKSWDDMWSPRVEPMALFRMHSRPRAANLVLVASFPGLVPVGSGEGKQKDTRVEETDLLRMLSGASNAAEVGEALIHFASQRLDRVCLFAVHLGKVSGWMARGRALDSADLRSFSVFAEVPSIFWELEDNDRYVGAIPPGPVNDDVLRVLGSPVPDEVLVTSLPMNGRVKGYLVGDIPGRKVPEKVQAEVVPAARAAGEALAAVLRGRN